MNKRELIEHINNTLFDNLKDTLFTEPTLSITESAKDNKVAITFETKKGSVFVGGMLKKFEKVTVPQFVSDWYEENKDDFEGNLFRCAHNIPSTFDGAKLNEFERWFLNASIKAFQILVNMHQFGYEVEKEKRYIVKVKGVEESHKYLNHRISLDSWFFSGESEPLDFSVKHTRKELEEAGFEEVFNSPLFEVKEVEE
ncbi:DUF1642 domain-containing protein [Streptococcus parasanguinis]|uniref:DUF1642 domain-containing protein n=1 Tax=Streptococcus parasanguinis TaxID=1318 RepID=UPI0012BC1A2C|nr:DUF1642 domain-containing protein [Streptococcus parasanguinis]MTR54195.1 DUF1642 domain-containing protein [Streptococcus parasanguinis]MTR56135.1 DUF1642 domain-containing protein [Streptococcus parasanguinis]MTR60767.1 DUF1642 domain-containing protein [Streptococcus parasanguinis]MTR69982.1 DUF1642 domain-containing protein [Streptococcus parasanguinis]MTS02496.1 DUF1642 domain-containing protein [Streptococcus parasanguinis]